MLKEKLKVSSREYPRAAGALFAYLFHRISMRELLEYIGDKEKGRHIQKLLTTDGYILRNCKLYAHNHSVGIRVSPGAYSVEVVDAIILRRLNLQHISAKYKPMTLDQFNTQVQEAVYGKEISAYTGRFISKKMMFLIRSYGVSREDIESQLQAAAIKGLYKQYPFFESELHLRNVAKTVIKNEGQTLISFHTRASRNRLGRTAEGGHQQLLMNLEAVFDVACEKSQTEEMKEAVQSLVALSPRMSLKVQRFLLLAAGQYDAEFSAFIHIDNREAVEHMAYPRYLKKVQSYLNVTDEQMCQLFAKLRPHL